MERPPAYEIDDDPTDELPALATTAVHRRGSERTADDLGGSDDTGEHTAVFSATALDPAPPSRSAAPASAPVATLMAEIERWAARCHAAEEQLAEKNVLVADLDGTIAATRRLLEERGGETERLTRELLARTTALEAAEAERTRLKEQLDRALDEAPRSLARRHEPTHAAGDVGDLERLREDHATLAAYVDNRKQWWDKAQADIASLSTKTVALEHELAARSARLADAEALASRESQRAAELRAQAAHYARQLREQLRTLRPSTSERATVQPRLSNEPSTATTRRAAARAPASPIAAGPPRAVPRPLPERTDVIAQLEAEIEYKRHQVAAQLVELHERGEQLRAAVEQLERTRVELDATRAELEAGRAARTALARSLDEKDRELAARDARIASLQADLNQRPGALQKLNAMDLSLQGLEAKIAERLAPPAKDETPSAPTLLCLTGDAPHSVALRPATVFGRAPHCDVQILTHYVSREHARIVIAADGATIEDLGSRNGVFVNAVKVERQRLRQGDLIKIGETQFRYVESVAH